MSPGHPNQLGRMPVAHLGPGALAIPHSPGQLSTIPQPHWSNHKPCVMAWTKMQDNEALPGFRSSDAEASVVETPFEASSRIAFRTALESSSGGSMFGQHLWVTTAPDGAPAPFSPVRCVSPVVGKRPTLAGLHQPHGLTVAIVPCEPAVNHMEGSLGSETSSTSISTPPSSSAASRERSPQKEALRNVPSKVSGSTKVRLSNTKILGQGTWGTVFVGWNEATRELIAVKEIKFSSNEDVEQTAREIRVMKSLEHPYIIKYLGADRDGNTLKIYMEYMVGGSLASLIKNFGALSEGMAAGYCGQVLQGLQYLHSLNIAHRDIKCDNLLVEKNGDVKLADFGQSKDASEILKTVTGTAYFMAPEVIKGGTYTLMADIWSFGCTVIEMLTGRPPYSQSEHQWAAMYRISNDDPSTQFPGGVTPTCRELLACCMVREPAQRWPAHRLLYHPFLDSAPTTPPGHALCDIEDERGLPPGSANTEVDKTLFQEVQFSRNLTDIDTRAAPKAPKGKRRSSAGSALAERPPPPLDAGALQLLAATVANRPGGERPRGPAGPPLTPTPMRLSALPTTPPSPYLTDGSGPGPRSPVDALREGLGSQVPLLPLITPSRRGPLDASDFRQPPASSITRTAPPPLRSPPPPLEDLKPKSRHRLK